MRYEDCKSVLMHFPPELLDRIDDWKEAQGQKLSRHLAVLMLIEQGLGAEGDLSARVEAEVQRRLRPLVKERMSVFRDEVRDALKGAQGNLKHALEGVLSHPS